MFYQTRWNFTRLVKWSCRFHINCFVSLSGQEDEEQIATGNPNQNITSSQSAGDQSTQEPQHGSLLTGKDNGSRQTGETDTLSENSGEDDIMIEKNGQNNAELENQYLRINLNDSSDAGDYEDRGTPIPMFTPPSPHVADRFCIYCNVVKKSPADLERHLRKHTGDRPFACQVGWCSEKHKTHNRETKSVVPVRLSFVYTSYVSVPVQTALKFGKQTVSFKFNNLKFDSYTRPSLKKMFVCCTPTL